VVSSRAIATRETAFFMISIPFGFGFELAA
jgi:hypothetical protein